MSPPDTATGVALAVVVPLPSAPSPLAPQQYAAPVVVTPQANPFPALTDANVSPPDTGPGVVVGFWPNASVVPLPSSP